MRKNRWIALAAVLVATVILLVTVGSKNRVSSAGTTTTARGAGNIKPSSAQTSASSASALAAASTVEKPALPPISLPLKQSFATLKQLADEGDAEAASRLYAQLLSCNKKRQILSMFQKSADSIAARVDAPDNNDEERAKLDSDLRRKLNLIEQLQRQCADIDQSELAEIAPVTLHAAQLGDADARDCYIHRGPLTNPQAAISNPELFDAYKNNVGQLIETGLAQGDWKVVDMLHAAYSPAGNSLLTGFTGYDPLQQYKYTKLYRLGATNKNIAFTLDEQLSALARTLTPTQLADADAWAQSSLSRFTGSSTDATPAAWDACMTSIHL